MPAERKEWLWRATSSRTRSLSFSSSSPCIGVVPNPGRWSRGFRRIEFNFSYTNAQRLSKTASPLKSRMGAPNDSMAGHAHER
jgi:hypothetical protein